MSRITPVRRPFTTAQGRDFVVSYFTVAGTSPGPVLTIIAGQHGMEHSGPNLLPELIEELGTRDFAGTVHVCPCANPLALEMDYEYYPEDEDLGRIDNYYYSIFRHNYCPWGLGRDDGETLYNMNRLWGLTPPAGVAGRIVAFLWDEIGADADIILDLHCLQAEKPLIFNSCEKNNAIARYCGIEAVVMTNPTPSEYHSGNLMHRGSRRPGQYTFCLEFSRQHGLKESEYELGKQAVRNVMAGTRMLEGEVMLERPVWKLPYDGGGTKFTVGHAGHIRYHFALYDPVRRGEKVYTVRDIQTLEILEEGIAGNDGILSGISCKPVVRPGDFVCWVPEVELLAAPGVPLPKLPPDFFRR